jgi:membrane protease YdiL (CAAX protease family)
VDTQVRCRFCDATNVSSALSCASCFMPIVDDLGEGGLDAATPAAPPAPPKPIAYGPYTGPPKAPTAPVEDKDEPEAAGSAMVAPGFRLGATIIPGWDGTEDAPPPQPRRNPNKILWRWYHLALLSYLIWWGPAAVDYLLGPDETISGILGRSFALQIVGYLVGFLAIAALVITRQRGDWGSLGIRRTPEARRDVMRGALFGAALFLAYLPVSLVLSQGHFSLDYTVRLVIGNASGAGLVLAAVTVIVGAPIIEEIFWRGMLYTKLARRSRLIAIVLTTISFTLAHGAYFIPAITLLGAALAIRRKKESLLFTMGAHSMWNTIVTVVAVFVLTGGGIGFASKSGSVHLDYPRGWERNAGAEAQAPLQVGTMTSSLELALDAANGSQMGSVEVTGLPMTIPPKAEMSGRFKNMPGLDNVTKMVDALTGGAKTTSIHESDIAFPGDPFALEMDFDVTSPTSGTGRAQVIVVMPPGTSTMHVFLEVCPSVSCESAEANFRSMMTSVTFGAVA